MKNKDILLFIMGGLAGAAIAWLLTSDEGKKIILDLKEKAGNLKDDLEKEWHEYLADFDNIINDTESKNQQS